MSNIESDDLENVPLVRMEDVQPSRIIICDSPDPTETFVVDNNDYETECVVNENVIDVDEENFVRSEDSDSSSVEMIVPEVLDSPLYEVPITKDAKNIQCSPPNSWPTLEILPGGVINPADKYDCEGNTEFGVSEMMYACAKCSESFGQLFTLVKHVRTHEEEKKRLNKLTDLSKLKKKDKVKRKLPNLGRKILISTSKQRKRKAPKRKP